MICRLCLTHTAEAINIFDADGLELNVAKVLAKYFWFKPQRDDPISTAICNACWNIVSNFHEFYLRVQETHRLLSERFSVKDEENNILHSPSLEETVALMDTNAKAISKFESVEGLDLTELETLIESDEIDTHVNSLSSTSELKSMVEEQMEIAPNEEPENPPQFRRSTRASTKENRDAGGNPQDSKVVPAAEVDVVLNKPRRGRPRKKRLDQPLSDDVPGVRDVGAEDTSSGQNVSKKVDAKITQHMQLICEICAAEAPTFTELRHHFKATHHRKGYAVCCSKKFYKRVLLVEHIDKHLNPDCYSCKECDKVFADKQCMRNHFLLKHHPDELKTFECEHCPKKFAKSYLLEQHRVVHEARIHICELCQRGFATPTLLMSHTKMIHGNYGTMCDICAKVIRGRSAFARHQLEHSGVSLPKVQCDICGSWHKDKYSLQKHRRRHNEEGSIYVCNICNKVAPNRSALRSHHRYVHVSQRTYECSVCKKSFKKAITLKEHMASHTGEVLYKCPHCPKTFNSNANMHSHRKKVHPKEFEETRNNRLKSKTDPNPPKSTVALARDAADAVSQFFTIKTTDEGETHSIMVTSGDFSDDDADGAEATSIIFTVS